LIRTPMPQQIYPNGKMGPHVDSLKIGETLELKGPIPKYPYKPNIKKSIGLVAGGTGIAPMIQVGRTGFILSSFTAFCFSRAVHGPSVQYGLSQYSSPVRIHNRCSAPRIIRCSAPRIIRCSAPAINLSSLLFSASLPPFQAPPWEWAGSLPPSLIHSLTSPLIADRSSPQGPVRQDPALSCVWQRQ